MALSKVPYDLLSGTASVSQLPAQLSINSGASSGSLAIDSSGRVTMPYQPFFVAGFSSAGDVTISSGSTLVYNQLLNNSASFNRGSHYSTSTGKFTAPVAGLYKFFWQTFYTSSASSTFTMQATPYVNGATQGNADAYGAQVCIPNGAGGTLSLCSDAVFLLSTGDTVEIRARSVSGLRIYTGHTYFGGHLIG